MSKLSVLNAEGVPVGRSDLSATLAAQEIKPHLIHETVLSELAARRAGTHSSKNRGEVSGGGVKPWRQKGTGRARQGSIRAPQWTGGGVVFGPTPRTYSLKVNRKVRRQAFHSALRAHAERGSAAIMEPLDWDNPSTKKAVEFLRQAQDALQERPLTLVVADLEGTTARSFRNLAGVTVMAASQVQTVDVMQARCLLVEREVWERFAGGDASVEEVEAAKKRKPRRKKPPEPKDAVPAEAEKAESEEEPEAEAEEPEAESEDADLEASDDGAAEEPVAEETEEEVPAEVPEAEPETAAADETPDDDDDEAEVLKP